MLRPSDKEQEHFAKLEVEKKRKWEEERAAKMEAEEKQRLKDLHYMKCPKCGMDLHTFEMNEVKLDRCVSCGGTWFDDGEIEQIMKAQPEGPLGKLMKVFR
jgi:uncharacterized protein